MEFAFVNVHGQRITPPPMPLGPAKRAKKEAAATFHKGWVVQGIPPGAQEAAAQAHAKVVAMAQRAGGRVPEPFDPGHWLMNARAKAVRAKPYEVELAARECAELARKTGWLRVEVVEKSKGEPKPGFGVLD